MATVNVQVCEGASSVAWRSIAGNLEELLPVRFVPSTNKGCDSPAGAGLWLGVESSNSDSGAPIGSSFEVGTDAQHAGNLGTGAFCCKFAGDLEVPGPFRGRTYTVQICANPTFLRLQAGERVLAEINGHPLWVVSNVDGRKCYRSGFPLPAIDREGSLLDVPCGERFVELLPLVHWLREISVSDDFPPPPLRACFVVDDPNLHWPRYGFVDFRELASHAAKGGYHVSFATIPLDAWFTHEPTASIFRNHPQQLSLSVPWK